VWVGDVNRWWKRQRRVLIIAKRRCERGGGGRIVLLRVWKRWYEQRRNKPFCTRRNENTTETAATHKQCSKTLGGRKSLDSLVVVCVLLGVSL